MLKTLLIHNPKCSKSRETLALLQKKNIDVTIRLYLESPLNDQEIRDTLSALGMTAKELLRTSEQVYKELSLKDKALDEDALIQIMIKHPKLIQRPIVVVGKKAKIGRPPEAVLDLF